MGMDLNNWQEENPKSSSAQELRPGELAPPYETYDSDQAAYAPEKKQKWGKSGGIVAVILLVLGKAKVLLAPLLFILKQGFLLLKFSKFAVTFISMFVMIWVYAVFYGWKFAVGFVFLIFMHENGHLWFAKIKGIPTSLPLFIPFMGAFVSIKEQPKSAQDEAFIAIGGPLVGALVALAFWEVYGLTGTPLWASLAYFGFFLNLFNLLPAHPMDGGRVASVLSPSLWLIGIVILAGFSVINLNPLLFIILIFAVKHWWVARKEIKAGNVYYEVENGVRMQWAFAYFLLTAALGYMMIHSLEVL